VVVDVNEAPYLVYNSSVYLSERARFGDGVGPALSAVDPDINDRITWSMPAGNTSLFRVTELAPKVAGIFVGPANTNTSLMFTDVSLVVLHTLDVSIVDSGGLSDRATVTVNVVDSNDAPIVTPATFSVAENSAVGVVVGTVSAADPDNLRAGVRQTLSFRISSGDNDRRFAINSGTGIITVAKSTLDFESASNYDLTVEVTDNAPAGTALSGYAIVTVRILDVNEAPVLATQFLTVSENVPSGTVALPSVGALMSPGADVDAGDVLTYTLRNSSTCLQ